MSPWSCEHLSSMASWRVRGLPWHTYPTIILLKIFGIPSAIICVKDYHPQPLSHSGLTLWGLKTSWKTWWYVINFVCRWWVLKYSINVRFVCLALSIFINDSNMTSSKNSCMKQNILSWCILYQSKQYCQFFCILPLCA